MKDDQTKGDGDQSPNIHDPRTASLKDYGMVSFLNLSKQALDVSRLQSDARARELREYQVAVEARADAELRDALHEWAAKSLGVGEPVADALFEHAQNLRHAMRRLSI